MAKKYIFFLLQLLLVSTLNAANISPLNSNMRVYSVLNGLSSNEVLCILQDSKGFMWYGTKNGLNRYDGYEFKSYKSNYLNPYYFSNNSIYCLAEDKSNNLWIGTSKGLNVLNLETGSVKTFNQIPILNKKILSIVIDKNNTPYIGSESGLFYFNRKTDKFISLSNDNNTKPLIGNYIKSLFIDSHNYLWIGIWNNGLFVYNLNTKSCKKIPFFENINPLQINSFFEDRNHNLWISNWGNGVYKLSNFDDPDKCKIEIYTPQKRDNKSKSPVVVYAINQDNKTGYILLATAIGLQIIDEQNKKSKISLFNKKNTPKILVDEIYTLYKDNEGSIWFSMFGAGIGVINIDNQFTQYNISTMLNNAGILSSITSIYERNSGELWLGIKSSVLAILDLNKKKVLLYKDNPILKTIHEKANSILCFYKPMKKDELWLGTRYDGLYVLRMNGDKLIDIKRTEINKTNLDNFGINMIAEDRFNNIWFATTDGLIKGTVGINGQYTFGREQKLNKALTGITLNTILIDSENNMWIGTSSDGLMKMSLNGKKNKIYSYNLENKKLNNNEVVCIFKDSKKRIWVGTNGGGLCLFDRENNTFRLIANMNLVPSDAIYSIQEDQFGNLWVGTGDGLFSYNPNEKLENAIRLYSPNNGLKIYSFNANSVFKNKSNEFFFGGSNGLVSFIPTGNKKKENKKIPFITDVLIGNIPLDKLPIERRKNISLEVPPYITKINIPYNDKNFVLEFSALIYQNLSSIHYAYKLDGVDKEWVYVDYKKRSVNYNNLPTGNYVFKVKSSNEDGYWSKGYSILKIKIEPAPWETWWAYLIYILFLISLSFLIIMFIYNRLQTKRIIAIDQIEREKSEEVHQAKMKFFTNISHEFFTPIAIMLFALETMQKKYPDEVKLVRTMKSNMDRLQRLLEQIVEFRKVETGNMKLKITNIEIVGFLKDLCEINFSHFVEKNNISLRFESSQNKIDGYVDVDKLDKIMFNLLSNAFKYNKTNGLVSVQIDKIIRNEHNYISITVSDTGKGMSTEVKNNIFKRFYEGNFRNFKVKSIGIGLSLTHDLIEYHKGEINVESEEGVGSKFKVLLPIDKEMYDKEQIFEQDIIIEPQRTNTPNEVIDENVQVTEQSNDKISLLIVEDNLELMEMMIQNMSSVYNLYSAYNGLEALDVLEKSEIDIVVTDVLMPKMDGIELVNAMKSKSEYSHIPIIMLTAKSSLEDKLIGFEAGADAYLSKPHELQVLIANINSIVKNRRLLASTFKKEKGLINIQKFTHNNTDKEFLEKVIAEIQKNAFNQDFSNNDLYSKLNMSQPTFYRKLNSLVGVSPNDLIRKIKIEMSCEMLIDAGKSISEIAYDLGFCDPKYFSKIFKKETGTTPTEYIKQNTEKPDN